MSMTESPEPVKKCALLRTFFTRRENSSDNNAFGPWRRRGVSAPLLLVIRQAAAGGALRQSRATLVLRLVVASCLASSSALAQIGGTAVGEAEPGASTTPEVRVDCPELAPEQIARVEARQMSELLSQQVQGVTLLLVCSRDRVSGIWQEGGVTVESRFLSRNASDSAVELLHWLASVLLELRSQRQEPPPTGAATVPVAGAAVATQAAPATEPKAEPAPVPPPAAAPPEPAASASSVDSPPRRPSPWTLELAAVYAHFGTEIAGALGPQAAVSYRILPRLHLRAAADVRLGLGSSEGFGMFDVGFAAGASYEVLPFLSLSLAPRLVLTTFTVPPEASGSGGPVVAGGAMFVARGRLPLHPLRPFVDLGIEAVGPVRQATLTQDPVVPVLTVPNWQGLVALGVELSL
jgi:hypothetical protein